MKYEEMKVMKQSEKSTVLLVRETEEERYFVKKILKGRHPIYSDLQNCIHPYLPRIYEVIVEDEDTTIIEEYIEGSSLGSEELSEKKIISAVKELCSALEFLHGKDIIHRDIKPSNIILAKDGHIRLIDYDAARKPKDDMEQDTSLLGTRGYAPPEQYGFTQTDARADIYSLGITLEQLLEEKAHKSHYKRIIRKCANLNPDKRYQSAKQVKRAFSNRERSVFYYAAIILLITVLWYIRPLYQPMQQENEQYANSVPVVLSAPENPHWDGETGIAVWGNVQESGSNGNLEYRWKLYFREDESTPPDVNETVWDREGTAICSWDTKMALSTYSENIGFQLWKNGYYYFAVAAVGDGVQYSDSQYVMSDVFHYTGENAPPLPNPTGLAWKVIEDEGQQKFATWNNLDDYDNKDSFNVRVYNQKGVQVSTNLWTKQDILTIGNGGIWFNFKDFEEEGDQYRFTVQAQTSRPNEFNSTIMPDPIPEEYYSPWYDPSENKN